MSFFQERSGQQHSRNRSKHKILIQKYFYLFKPANYSLITSISIDIIIKNIETIRSNHFFWLYTDNMQRWCLRGGLVSFIHVCLPYICLNFTQLTSQSVQGSEWMRIYPKDSEKNEQVPVIDWLVGGLVALRISAAKFSSCPVWANWWLTAVASAIMNLIVMC